MGVWPADATLPAPLSHSMKGYELYSWKVSEQWHFTLIVGTNRIKTFDEIVSPNDVVSEGRVVKISAEGVDAIKAALGRLAKGEEIFWDGRCLDQPQTGAGALAFPPDKIISDVRGRCEELGLSLHVNRP